MYILCKSNKQPIINLPSIAKGCAKYVYKNLDGAFEIYKDSQGWIVYSTILYQIPKEVADRYGMDESKFNTVNELDVRIDFKTYADKLRVEVIELKPDEKTIGFKTFKDATFNNIQDGYKKTVMAFVVKSINKEFEGFDILF